MTVIALDVGGTKILGAAFEHDLKPSRELGRVLVPTPRADDGRGDPDGHATASVVHELAAYGPVEAICIGVPEYVDDGTVTSEEVLAWAPGTTATLEQRFGAPTRWASDVRCGALGEWTARAAQPELGRSMLRSMLYVSLGTGISHTLIVDGIAVEGAHGEAIALGEMRQQRGSAAVESQCSGRGVVESWTAANGPLDPAALFNPPPGSPQAEFLEAPAGLLGWAIAQAALLLDPGCIVLGGGLGSRDTLYRHLVAAAVAEYGHRRSLELQSSIAGSDAGLLGAAQLASLTAAGNAS